MAIRIYHSRLPHVAAVSLEPGETVAAQTMTEHWGDCPKNDCGDSCRHDRAMPAPDAACGPKCCIGYWVVSCAGCVVAIRERNGYDDSDFYATVVDPQTLASREVLYASTRGWTYENSAFVDAPDELVVAWRAKIAADAAALHAQREATEIRVGVAVRVTSKRSKIPHGTVGTVAWRGRSTYGGEWRVGIDIDGERRYCAESCVVRA